MAVLGFEFRALVDSGLQPRTGLDFDKENGEAGGNIRFFWEGAGLIQRYPRTQIWRSTYRHQPGYYCTWFRIPAYTPGNFFADRSYEGCHPYPWPVSSTEGEDHHHEVAVNGQDTPSLPENLGEDDNGNSTEVEKDREYIHAFRCRLVSGDLVMEYFYDLPDLEKVVTYIIPAADLAFNGADHEDHQLFYGSSSWTAAGTANNECANQILRGLQNYEDWLNNTNMLAEAANDTVDTPQTEAGQASVHYMNQNPTPDDISDKSGQENHPAWVGALRPALWQEA